MAYNPWFRSVVLSLLATVASIATGFVDVLAYLVRQPFELFQPDAAASLALDRIAHAAAEPSPIARFKAFIERALTHPSFTAGQFATGRMPA